MGHKLEPTVAFAFLPPLLNTQPPTFANHASRSDLTETARVFNSPIWSYDPVPALAAAAQSALRGGMASSPPLPHHPEGWKVSVWQVGGGQVAAVVEKKRGEGERERGTGSSRRMWSGVVYASHAAHAHDTASHLAYAAPSILPAQVDNRLGTFIAVRANSPPPPDVPRTVRSIEERAGKLGLSAAARRIPA